MILHNAAGVAMVLLALAAAQGRGSDMAGSMGQGGAGTMASQHAAGVTPDQSGDTARQDAAIDAMSSMHMSDGMAGHSAMSEHMAWSDTRLATDADRERAREIVKTLQTALAKYKDYHVAEAHGFRPFHPELRQDIYHFTRWQNGLKAAFTFDPAEPTSLLYKKTSHDGYAWSARCTPRRAESVKRSSISACRSELRDGIGTSTFASRPRNSARPPTGRSSASTARLRPRRRATRQADGSIRRSSDGWCTSIRGRRRRKPPGRTERLLSDTPHRQLRAAR
jgi:hypothetical protein